VRLNEAEMIDDDLRIGMAADECDPLIEPPGNVQVLTLPLAKRRCATRGGGAQARPGWGGQREGAPQERHYEHNEVERSNSG
jgi:hypothetical protein